MRSGFSGWVFGGLVASIPACVLGGMTTFLFANVIVSGITVLSKVPMTRRNRFILALSLGIGVAIAPGPLVREQGALRRAFHSVWRQPRRPSVPARHSRSGWIGRPLFLVPHPASRQPKQNRPRRR